MDSLFAGSQTLIQICSVLLGNNPRASKMSLRGSTKLRESEKRIYSLIFRRTEIANIEKKGPDENYDKGGYVSYNLPIKTNS